MTTSPATLTRAVSLEHLGTDASGAPEEVIVAFTPDLLKRIAASHLTLPALGVDPKVQLSCPDTWEFKSDGSEWESDADDFTNGFDLASTWLIVDRHSLQVLITDNNSEDTLNSRIDLREDPELLQAIESMRGEAIADIVKAANLPSVQAESQSALCTDLRSRGLAVSVFNVKDMDVISADEDVSELTEDQLAHVQTSSAEAFSRQLEETLGQRGNEVIADLWASHKGVLIAEAISAFPNQSAAPALGMSN